MEYRIWCRWGELPLDATDEESAIEEAVSFALRNGKYVVLLDEDRNEIVHVPPAPQASMILTLLFDGLSPVGGIVESN